MNDSSHVNEYVKLDLYGKIHWYNGKTPSLMNLSKLVNRMENIVEAELGIETPWLFPHVLPIHLDDLSYQQILEEVLDYNPPLKNEKAIDLYIRKKMSFRLYKDYYDLYQYFNNKLYPDGMPDSSDEFIGPRSSPFISHCLKSFTSIGVLISVINLGDSIYTPLSSIRFEANQSKL